MEHSESSAEWKFMALNAYIKKEEKSQINNNDIIIYIENQKVSPKHS